MKCLFFIVSFFAFMACNQSGEPVADKKKIDELQLYSPSQIREETTNETMAPDTAAFAPPQPGVPQRVKHSSNSSQVPDSKPDWNKKIIKTATVNVEVKDYSKFNQLVHAAANQFGGYIADEQQIETEYKIENTITLKVPVDQFQSAVDFLTTGDGKINEKKISSEDVTTQYVDTKSRLEAKKQVRLRYLDLLKQAKNMEEVLQVQNEINEIQEAIESAAGRMNYLSNSSAMSTIHLTFYQVLNPTASDQESNGVWKKLKSAFLTGWHGVGDVLIGLVYIWPLLLLGATVAIILRRFAAKKPRQD